MTDDTWSPLADTAGLEDPGDAGGEETGPGDAPPVSPSTGLLSFYDHLRARVARAAARRGGRMGETAVRVLLVVPDMFMLLVRLTLDREVPASTRTLVGGALAYFLLPIDLLPEVLVGVGGYVDDVVLAAAILSHVFGPELEPYARKHWSGPEDLRVVLKDISGAARALLGENLYERLTRLLDRRGVRVEEEPSGKPDVGAMD
jgi:uncharacterized membrane protein YkvA (DUF1232 family)